MCARYELSASPRMIMERFALAAAHVHDRMPVILDPDGARAWADPTRRFAQVAPLLVPYVGGLTAAEDAPPAPAQGSLFAQS